MLLISLPFSISGCASAKKFFAVGTSEPEVLPIDDPFGYNGAAYKPKEAMTWRAKKGDQSVELEIPGNPSTDIEMPLTQTMSDWKSSRGLTGNLDSQYENLKPTTADREIVSTFNLNKNPEDEASRREIEGTLGLKETDELPQVDQSYLAKMDAIKQLFKSGRYEAALIEIDQLVKIYPTSAKLYEMRGTVLDRMGYSDLAMRSWKQALEFRPNNLALKKLIDRRETSREVSREVKRGVASEGNE